ncbi:MAG: glycerol-3-phosphate acyltransferase [Ignavibacteriae bacterium]|nr:glycerol-3-phosphate acyltransferase [Ignavibacteriota bacterium]NOG98624.1 glycerol-3-phosphate acyltransferase [Ignavibacteriota bacterium]
MILEFILSSVIGFILGSIPTAYILVKKKKGIDLRETGSNNIGALNSYEVSNSKLIGILVLLIDFGKGLLAVYLTKLFFEPIFLNPMLALLFAVLAHCYSPWIKFKGGRGLATAAGGSLLFLPAILVLWMLFWVIAFIFRKHIHFANIAATFLTGAIAATSANVLNKYSFPPADSELIYGIFTVLMLLIILIKHKDPFKEWLNARKQIIKER